MTMPAFAGIVFYNACYIWVMDVSYILNHLGEEHEKYFGAVAPPVIQTSNFGFKDVESLRRAFTDEKNNHIYTRGNNPTVAILRKKIAALAGAEDALVFSSGTAAIAAAVLANVKAGSHVVCVNKPYSWTEKLLQSFLPRFGVTVTMVDGTDAQNFARAVLPNTSLFILESPNTFTFELQDIEAVVKIARQHGIVTMLDNSYNTSLGQRVIEMGVDIEIHSASKYYGGHSDVVAGYLIGSRTVIDSIFASEQMNIGAIISPNDAWLLLRSLRTLPLRMQRVAATAQKVIAYMQQHPLVEKVTYPFLPHFPQYALAKKQMLWCGGLFNATIKARNVEEVELFCNSLKAFLMAVSWGGHESLVIPACSFYPKPVPAQTPYPYNLIRFYVGLEDADYLVADLRQAFNKLA